VAARFVVRRAVVGRVLRVRVVLFRVAVRFVLVLTAMAHLRQLKMCTDHAEAMEPSSRSQIALQVMSGGRFGVDLDVSVDVAVNDQTNVNVNVARRARGRFENQAYGDAISP
jgi:hypothetical protein